MRRTTLLFAFLVCLAFCGSQRAAAQTSEVYFQRGDEWFNNDRNDSARHYYHLALAVDTPGVQLRAYTSLLKLAIDEADYPAADSIASLAETVLTNEQVAPDVRNRYRAMRGNGFSRNGEYRRALDLMLPTLADQTSDGDERSAAITLKDIALTYQRMQLPDSSVYYIDRANELMRRTHDTTGLDYTYFLNDAGVVYFRADRPDEAERFWLRGIAGLKRHGMEGTQRMGYAYDNLSNVYNGRGDYDRELEYRHRALAIHRALGNKLDEAVLLFNLGIYHFYTGNFGAAADYVNTALQIRESFVGVGHPSLINNYHAQAVLQAQGGQPRKALSAFHRILAAARRNTGPESDQVARFLDDIGATHHKLNQLDSSIYYRRAALAIFAKNSRRGSEPMATARYNYSIVLAKAGRYEEALRQSKLALEQFQRLGLKHNVEFTQYLANHALRLIDLQRLPAAREEIVRALTVLREQDGYKLGPTATDALGIISEAVFSLYQAGQRPDDLALYRELERAYVATTEMTRRQFHDPYSKGLLNDQRAAFLKDNIDRYVELYNASEDPDYLKRLYELSELTKATAVRDRLRSGVRKFRGVPDSVRAREAEFQTQIEELYFAVEDANGERADSLRGELLGVRSRYDEFNRKLALDYPRYYDLTDEPNIVTLTELRTALRAENDYLETPTAVVYLAGQENYYALIIQPADVKLATCGPVATIADAVTTWRTAVSSVLTNDHLPAANELHRLLWQPVEPALTSPAVKIIPDGVLSSVSFDALTRATDEPDYLVHHYTFSYAYSLGLYLQQSKQDAPDGATGLVGVAPGFYPEMRERYRQYRLGETFSNEVLSAPSQPYAMDLVTRAGRTYRGQALTGERATETGVRTAFGEASLLLFATHGFVDRAQPLQSGMQLALGEASTTPEDGAVDGFLSTAEIFNSSIPADLSILSLCESGIGKLTAGDGMLSLAYGFSYAGCASTMNTLWKVDDQINSGLTEAVLHHLSDGMGRASALRQAKLDHLAKSPAELSHPFYWAALVLQGKDGSVAIERRGSGGKYRWLLGATLLAGLVVGLLYRSQK